MERWQESEHPRHPEGSERGGRFRGKAGGWLRAVAAQLTRRTGPGQEFADRIAHSEIVERGRLRGGRVAKTELLTMRDRDGATFQIVRKWSDSPGDTPAEIRASAIGRAIGAPVPIVVPDPRDDRAVYMEYIDGVSAIVLSREYEELGRGGSQVIDDLENLHADTPGGRLLGMLDLLIGNKDRNPGNWLIARDGSVHGIDHAITNLGMGVEQKYVAFNAPPSQVWAGWRRTPFSSLLVVTDRSGPLRLARNDFDPSDLALARERLTTYIASNPPELGEDQARDLMIRFDLIAGMARHG